MMKIKDLKLGIISKKKFIYEFQPIIDMIKIKRKIGPKGQIVLPKDVREQFNLKTGTDVIFSVEDQKIIIETPKNHKEIIEEFCTLPENMKKRKIYPKQIKELIEDQYEERFRNLTKVKK